MTRKPKTPKAERFKGRKMLAQMLYEIRDVKADESSLGMDPYSLYAEYRCKDEPQVNIVLKYLQRAAAQGDGVVAGFCSALSDYCGCNETCGKQDAEIYLYSTERAMNEGGPQTREELQRERREAIQRERGASLH